jgi:UDP-N-acetylmuramoyl-tripeptide--D-alanyl-D-alanine ligase
MNITVKEAAAICGGKLYGENIEDVNIGRVIIDSRAVEPGDMFAAYRGENVDGHNYIGTALEKGASCCLAEYLPEGVSGTVIVTDSVQRALEKIAAAYRAKLNIPIVGITGSVGKTTAKEMVWAVLSRKLNTLKTDGNLNNQIGVPMTLSRITNEHKAAVVEMGISGFGEMTELAKMARPTIAIYTVIGHAHLEFLHDLAGVFKAKTEMLDCMPESGTVIVNGDDEYLKKLQCRQQLIKCGMSPDCDVRPENIQVLSNGYTSCDIRYKDRCVHAKIPAYGKHMIYAAMEGAAAGFVLGLSDEEIAEGIADYKVVGRRGAVTVTDKLTLVDDCYNANPDSMRCAIDSVSDMPGRHIAVLADMLEMGEGGKQLHLDIGQYAVSKGIEQVLCCGELGKYIAHGAGEHGEWYDSLDSLKQALPKKIKPGDTVLVKASRGMHLEEVSEFLKSI